MKHHEISSQAQQWQLSLGTLLCLVGLFATAGCGDGRPARVPISGQVLIDGQPLRFGSIRFIPDNARPSSSKLDSEGRFTLYCFEKDDGAVLGRHRITVNAGEPLSGNRTHWHAPKAYVNVDTAHLRQEITKATENVTVNLTWNGGKPFVEKNDADADGVATVSQ
jgi:hypothetical protein